MAQILSNGQIKVQSGDTLYKIAQQVLGDGNRWKELGYNGDPGKLAVGTVLTSPTNVSVGSGAPAGVENLMGPPRSKLSGLIDSAPTTAKPKASSTSSTATSAAPTDPDSYITSVLDTFTKPFLDAQARVSNFDKNNPFAFDEAAARSSASERLDPYYNSLLGDYVSGVERSKGRTIQDSEKLRQELTISTEDAKSDSTKLLDRAVRSSEQGFAGNNLYFSGDRLARTGELTADATTNADRLDSGAARKLTDINTNQARTLEDLAAGKSTFERNLNAEKTTATETDVNSQKNDAEKAYALARENAAGYPYTTGSSSIQNLFGLS